MHALAHTLVTTSGGAAGKRDFLAHGPQLSAAAKDAIQKLQTDLKAAIPAGARPGQSAVDQMRADMTAIHNGTITGAAIQTTISNDQAAILASMGASPGQVAQIQADEQAVQVAMPGGHGQIFLGGAPMVGNPPLHLPVDPPLGSPAAASAWQTLSGVLKADLPAGATPSQASLTILQTDLASVRSGALSGSSATSQIQSDAAGVLESMGVTPTQVSQIQADEQAVVQAMSARNSSTTSAAATPPANVGIYLAGLPVPGGMMRFHR